MAAEPLLARLEAISRVRPDRVLRLCGSLPPLEAGGSPEACELVIYRGFSSSTTHPTAFDPDAPVLPPGAVFDQADLLEGPLNPAAEQVLVAAVSPERFAEPEAWL